LHLPFAFALAFLVVALAFLVVVLAFRVVIPEGDLLLSLSLLLVLDQTSHMTAKNHQFTTTHHEKPTIKHPRSWSVCSEWLNLQIT
jgi:hypothetical protein